MSNCVPLISTAPTPQPGQAECNSYIELSGAERKMSFSDKKWIKCDSMMHKDWYRFTGAAGSEMPQSCVPTYHCGTHAPGWLNGEHPKVADGIVTREVCYHWSNNCCRWKNNIRIRNCGKFYVYELVKPPACSLRYCGTSGGLGECMMSGLRYQNKTDETKGYYNWWCLQMGGY